MKKIIRVILVLGLLSLISGCQQKSDKGIKPIKNQPDIKTEVNEKLPEGTAELIQEYIPKVIAWYNSVDISKTLTVDFVDDEIDALGEKLTDNEVISLFFDARLSGKSCPEELEAQYKALQPAVEIPYQIATIMMESDINFNSSHEDEAEITIKEEDWKLLRDNIEAAKEFYFGQ